MADRPKRVLFVCVENSCRSQIAEAFAQMHGANKVKAYSAGSRPSGQVNPKAINAMKELGYDLGCHSSKTLSEIPDVEFDFVVTMGCGDECPFVRTKEREDWNIPDPKDMEPDEFRDVRDIIESKVKNLIAKFSVPSFSCP
ncbi:MAG: arsenate reductase ArsC [Candidatus Binatia bacterium]